MKNNRHAVLVMAHNNLYTLKKLLSNLDSNYFDIFIHIDLKSTIEQSDVGEICKLSNVYIFKEKDIRWADYSQTDAELYLLEKAIDGKYSYYHLISGNDMIISSPKNIYDFFEEKEKNFVHFSSENLPKEKLSWVKYYHPFMPYMRNNMFFIALDKIGIILQKIFLINRLKSFDYKIMTGANWFSIRFDLAEYILKNKAIVKKLFTKTRSSDEMFVQTLLYNSKFKDELYDPKYNDDYNACKRYIVWNGTKPEVFTREDFEKIINSNMFFARKFDEKIDKEIIDKIHNYVEKLKEKDFS